MQTSDLAGAGVLLAYYLVVCAGLPTVLRTWARAPFEWVRKLQHVAYALSIFILLRMFSTWYAAVAAAFLLVLVAYPALMVIERFSWYRRTFVDRASRGGELRTQLLYVQLSFALLLFLFWGILGVRGLPVIGVAVMAWGFGDAAAAIVGKTWGKQRVLNRFVDGFKTFEGTAAMMVVAGVALFLTLVFFAHLPWYISLLIAALVAPVSGVVELFSHRGTDTLTVPLATAAALAPLMLGLAPLAMGP